MDGLKLRIFKGEGFGVKIFLAALVLRLVFSVYFLSQGLDAVYGRDLYYDLAQAWLGWTARPAMDATHPPLYSALIAMILWCFGGPSPVPVVILQTLLGSLVPVFVWRLGSRLASEGTGRLAAAWTCVDPLLIFYVPHLQTETFFVFLETSFFLCLYRNLERPQVSGMAWAATGFLAAAAALCRSVFAAYPAMLIPLLAWQRGPRRMAVPLFLFFIGWLLPISAWTARNWVKYHAIIPMSAQMGWTLYEGFSLDREEIRRRPYEMDAEARARGVDGPVERSRYFKNKTLELVRSEPWRAAKIIAGKAALYWRPFPYDPYSKLQRALMGLYFMVLFFFAGFGAWEHRRQSAAWGAIFALFLYLTAMHSLFFTSLRYRSPLEPFLCLLGAAGMLRAARWCGLDWAHEGSRRG